MVFSDELTIAVQENWVQIVRRWPKINFCWMYEENSKISSKTIVLGAISFYGPSRLLIFVGMMNQTMYIEVLNSKLLPQISQWYSE